MAYFTGTSDNDTYTGGVANDGVTGVGGDDVLGGDAGQDTIFGGDGHDWIDGGTGADILGGGMGNDTFVVDSSDDSVLEGTNQGIDLVRASVSFSLAGRQIEYLTLTGAAHINATGNGFNNLLVGNGGNNVLDGGAGADVLQGGLGDDTYYVDNVGDNVVEAHWQGTDTVYSTVTYSLFGRAVENLILTGSGNTGVTGNSLANRLTGNAGNNVFDGAGGNDTMTGGAGDDTYYVDASRDNVVETYNEGNDLIYASASYSLVGRVVETLILTGAANIDAIGNSQANILIGNSGNNLLDGAQGLDVMTGGLGDDTYVINYLYDKVTELAGEGIDTVFVSKVEDYHLGANLENMVANLIGAYGNELDNVITGSQNFNQLVGLDGNDTLFGLGGDDWLHGEAGADYAAGGVGDDSYWIENAGDVVFENAGEGTDRISTSVSFTLPENVEILSIVGNGNKATGNSAANTLRGFADNNVFDGGGGADTLSGGAGHDTYYVDGDDVIEDTDGFDLIVAPISYSLEGTTIESLTLTGTGDLNGTGNGVGNILSGNAGNNRLDAGAGGTSDLDQLYGGAGSDTLVGNGGQDRLYGEAGSDVVEGAAGNDLLWGGGGSDLFLFAAGSGQDTVNDFSAAENDTLHLTGHFAGVVSEGSVMQVDTAVRIDLTDGGYVLVLNAVRADVLAHIVW
ncbi:hypothetical protein ABAC460_22990 [Asticcacaulis sp. AC460]|uniref:beta strand repeat-containing protein n=1 Tax=Asticcacaulis sp. AC460 TaxID=1282360 RepID=UPI0003C3B1DF|nr:calcium-binding protein [Asticcacaulis sp. AC460]ESQ86582.1 hypothetical protein ABAC460_22990 [Asticcacaulis sp. AC460]